MTRKHSETQDKLVPGVYFKKYEGEKRAATVKIEGKVINAHLTRGGRYGYYTVTLETDLSFIRDLCDSAMRVANRL